MVLDLLSNFVAVFLGIFIEAAPFLFLGTLASGIVDVFVSPEMLGRWLPKKSFWGALVGCLLGFCFPVCECGVVPFARKLMKKGASPAVGIGILLAAPALNPISLASTLAAFGWGPVLWGRVGLTLLVALAVAWIMGGQSLPGELLRGTAPEPTAEPAPQTGRARQVLVVAADEFFEMGRYLVLGGLLAAGLQTFVPRASLVAVGQGPVLSVVVMLALAVLLSVCSTVDAFIALAFVGTFSTGSLLAFLVYGPMVDIKSTWMYFGLLKPRAVVYLVLLPLVMVLLAGVGLNLAGMR